MARPGMARRGEARQGTVLRVRDVSWYCLICHCCDRESEPMAFVGSLSSQPGIALGSLEEHRAVAAKAGWVLTQDDIYCDICKGFPRGAQGAKP